MIEFNTKQLAEAYCSGSDNFVRNKSYEYISDQIREDSQMIKINYYLNDNFLKSRTREYCPRIGEFVELDKQYKVLKIIHKENEMPYYIEIDLEDIEESDKRQAEILKQGWKSVAENNLNIIKAYSLRTIQ